MFYTSILLTFEIYKCNIDANVTSKRETTVNKGFRVALPHPDRKPDYEPFIPETMTGSQSVHNRFVVFGSPGYMNQVKNPEWERKYKKNHKITGVGRGIAGNTYFTLKSFAF